MYNSIYFYGLVALIVILFVVNIILWWLIHHTKGCVHSHTTPFDWKGTTLYKCERCGAILDQAKKEIRIGKDLQSANYKGSPLPEREDRGLPTSN